MRYTSETIISIVGIEHTPYGVNRRHKHGHRFRKQATWIYVKTNINVSSYAICVFNEIGVTTNIVLLQNTSNSWTLQDCLPKHQLELKDELRSLKKTFFKVRRLGPNLN